MTDENPQLVAPTMPVPPKPTEDEVLFLQISAAVIAYSIKQGEILRLASYLSDRAEEIDDPQARAMQLLEELLPKVDGAALEEAFSTLRGRPKDSRAWASSVRCLGGSRSPSPGSCGSRQNRRSGPSESAPSPGTQLGCPGATAPRHRQPGPGDTHQTRYGGARHAVDARRPRLRDLLAVPWRHRT